MLPGAARTGNIGPSGDPKWRCRFETLTPIIQIINQLAAHAATSICGKPPGLPLGKRAPAVKISCHQSYLSPSYDPASQPVEINVVDMPQLVSVANADSRFSAAVKRFEALAPTDQLSVLVFMLSYEVGRTAFAKTSGRTSDEHAAAIKDKPPSHHSSDSKVVVSPGLESEPRGGSDLAELTAAANIHFVEDYALSLHRRNRSSSCAKARKPRSVRLPKQPPTNSQSFSIPMTISIPMMMIVSFSLTLGTMLWQRKTERVATPELEIAAPVAEPRGSPNLVPVHDTGEPPLLRPREPSKLASPQSLVKQSIVGEGDRSPGVVPVAINIWNRRNRHRIEGYVWNTSGRQLSLMLEVVGQGNSVLHLDLPPSARRELSAESGFEMQSNDRVIVRSEPFQDLVTEVP